MPLVKCAMEASFGGSTDDSAGNFDGSSLNLASLHLQKVCLNYMVVEMHMDSFSRG